MDASPSTALGIIRKMTWPHSLFPSGLHCAKTGHCHGGCSINVLLNTVTEVIYKEYSHVSEMFKIEMGYEEIFFIRRINSHPPGVI